VRQQADHGVDVDESVDRAALDRGHRTRACADADEGRIIALQAVLDHEMLHHEMGARSRRGHADLHVLEIRRRAIARSLAVEDAEHVTRELSEQDHRDDGLVLGLHLDGVIIGARDDVGAAADERLQRPRTAGKIGNLDVEAVSREIAEAIGDREREIKQRGLAADCEPHRALLRPLAARG
jgi:hypothetical protein